MINAPLLESELRFFVYGTLKPGQIGFLRYCQAHQPQVQPAKTSGRIYHLPVGYPAMTAEPGQVQGVLLRFPPNPEILHTIDRYEDHDPQAPPAQNLYQRLKQEIWSLTGKSLGLAWIYLMEVEKVQQQGGVWLEQGYWLADDSKESPDNSFYCYD